MSEEKKVTGGPRGPRGPHGGMMPGEKAKDFRGTFSKLMRSMGKYRAALFGVAIFAAGSTVFNIVGPKVLARATTELFNGMMARFAGTGGINFGRIGEILRPAVLSAGNRDDGDFPEALLPVSESYLGENQPDAHGLL